MNRSSQRGIALVITLLMLSVVTLMSVVFLAMSQREKASVNVSADNSVARRAADAALARAQAEVATRILATANPYSIELLVSTNLVSSAGFQSGLSHPTNVSYTYANGGPLTGEDQLQNLANLQYDPRPPVFVPRANRREPDGGPEFRFYLDLNRNRAFEPTGLWPTLGPNGQPLRDFGRNPILGHFAGDPQWVGILERPDLPHSETNRFVARYAYLVLPAGKSLDLNFIHNHAKGTREDMSLEGFSRNQGFGSWELNLAGFFQVLNTNSWLGNDYVYNTNPGVPSSGRAFEDALYVLRHRYLGRRSNLALGSLAFQNDTIDSYGDGPLSVAGGPRNMDLNNAENPRPWPGSDNPHGYFDTQEFFDTNRVSLGLLTRLAAPMTNSQSSYDRYTLYRLLSQLGADSKPALSNLVYQADFQMWPTNKLHLNYRGDLAGGVTNFVSWEVQNNPFPQASRNPVDFFSRAADRMLRVSLLTNIFTNTVGVLETNFFLGDRPVRQAFNLTNIQIYHVPSAGRAFYNTNNEYSATLHRLLQVAANTYDATTIRRLNGRDYPSLFRPIYRKTSTNVCIAGFVEENTANFLNFEWITPEQLMGRADGIYSGVNLYGVPSVVGVKKGFPNFNEFSVETAVQVSRKLEVRKPATNAPPNITNQMYVVGISNIFGVEAWNSYTQNLAAANLELIVTNQYSLVLSNAVDNTVGPARVLFGGSSRRMMLNEWPGREDPNSFILPVLTNVLFLTNSAYIARTFPYFFEPTGANAFERSFDPPQLFLYITNRLQYALVDHGVQPPRVVDFVNLDRLVSFLDISRALAGDSSAGGGGMFRDEPRIGEGDLWNPARTIPGNLNAPTLGVTNQIAVALGDPRVAADVWRSYIEDPVTGGDKGKAIQKFREFLTRNSTNLVMQVPFSPTRKFYLRNAWQANDPLVHYAAEDLSDPVLTNPGSTNNLIVLRPPNSPLPQSNLGRVNDRYRPWGGKGSADPTGYAMSVKDPLIRSSDDWSFPTNKFPNIGWLGRVHRGTPWQTIYLKATTEPPDVWLNWAGSHGTHPTNDWKLLDLFTVAPNANAARGLLSVNQTNLAAWSAVFSGVAVLSNSLSNPGPLTGTRYDDIFIHPNSPQLRFLVNGINRTRSDRGGQVFSYMGDVLATPELTVASPFLNLSTSRQIENGLTDEVVERIPQQVLSLLKQDEPRVVVYAFGQSLRPAERSLVTSGNFYNLCTNYQITGEVVTKTLLRFDGAPQKPKAVVESFSLVPPD